MPCLEGVLEEGIVVGFIPLDADAALCKHGIAAGQILLADEKNVLRLGQLECGI